MVSAASDPELSAAALAGAAAELSAAGLSAPCSAVVDGAWGDAPQAERMSTKIRETALTTSGRFGANMSTSLSLVN